MGKQEVLKEVSSTWHTVWQVSPDQAHSQWMEICTGPVTWQAEWLAASSPVSAPCQTVIHLLTGPPSSQLLPRSPFTLHPSSFRMIQDQPGMSLNKTSLSPRETVVRAHGTPGTTRFIPLVQLLTCPCYVKARRVCLPLEPERTQEFHDCYLQSLPHL